MGPLGFRSSSCASSISGGAFAIDEQSNDARIESLDSSDAQSDDESLVDSIDSSERGEAAKPRIHQHHGTVERSGKASRTASDGEAPRLVSRTSGSTEFESLTLSASDSDDDSDAGEETMAASSCSGHWAALGAMRGAAEYVWQGGGRMLNAACFVLLPHIEGESLRYTATALSAAGAGYCAYRLLCARPGKETCASRLAAAAGSVVVAGAAGVATYMASTIPGATIAVAGTIGFIVSGLQRHAACNSQGPDQRSAFALAAPPALVVLGSAASIGVAVAVPALRSIDHGKLGRRTLALLAESATVELLKGSTEHVIPGIDRNQLPFERRLRAGLIGMLPYAVASIVLGGAIGNLLRAQMKSDRFEDYLVPLLAGALSNVVKGAVNTALLRCGGSPCGENGQSRVRPAEGLKGLKLPQADKLFTKTALRFMLMHGRDVMFLALVDGGLAEIPAAVIAFALYAFFAQHRDLMFELMEGDGWSEPQVTARPEISPA